MKNTRKILIAILMLTFILLFSTTSLAAKGSFSVSQTSVTLTEGKTSTFTIKTSNCEGKFTISSSDTSVVNVSSSSEWVSNSTTITLTAVKAGTAKITITADNVGDTDENEVTGSKTISVTVKAKSTSSSSSSSSNNSSSGSSSSSSNSSATTKAPTFKSVNQTVYTTNECNLRSSWSTSSSAVSVPAGTELKLTGTSTQTIDGYTWYRVTYNGATKYIASSLITYTKPEEDDKSSNKNLSSLSIEGIEITPAFDKDTTQYTATVDGDVTELKIDAKAEDSKATVTIEGNEELKEGDNVIKIKVTAEDGTTRTYFITVTKGEGTVTDNTLKLSELKIERVNFEGSFDPDIYTYELPLNTYVDSLEITATPNQADATVEIIGNSNFQVGENVVTILLTSADGTQTATYQIKVNIAEELAEEKGELGTVAYVIIGIVIAAVIIGIYLFIRHYRKIKKGKIADGKETDINFMPRYTTTEGEKEDKKKTFKKEKSDVTVDDFLNNTDENENQEKPKKPKGRHSR